jgi:predicted AAA+ superfamily ATPase
MKRFLEDYLSSWLTSNDRKPLVLRGARQVGKTWLVRHLAKTQKKELIELNFEKHPEFISYFASNDPKIILLNLSAHFNKPIHPDECLLFLDEIQAAPVIFSKLRWFAEDLPELPVVATGSLLEFLLADHAFSMPVGRITYAHLEPLSFEEFLWAQEKEGLYAYLTNYTLETEIPSALHDQLIRLFKEYLLVGGLPAAVLTWRTKHSLQDVSRIHHDLLTTYRDDFAKYKTRIATEKLEEVLSAIPKMLGQKFVYSKINPNLQNQTVKQIINLFEKARLANRVRSTAGNGTPLAAEIKEKYFKEIFIDTGLCSALLGLNLNLINAANEITFINQGGIAEQVTGQLLRTISPPYIEPSLYYWHREEPGSSAEIDYLIQHGSEIIPIEVKAGTTGTLKSLHFFMALKNYSRAIRINSDLPYQTQIDTKTSTGTTVKYTLISLPFYLIGQLHRLLESAPQY